MIEASKLLGYLGYYRYYIIDFTKIAKPIIDLLITSTEKSNYCINCAKTEKIITYLIDCRNKPLRLFLIIDCLKIGFHLSECADSAEAARIRFDWSGDYRSMGEFKLYELHDYPIRPRVAFWELTFEPTMNAQTRATSAESVHSFKWKPPLHSTH